MICCRWWPFAIQVAQQLHFGTFNAGRVDMSADNFTDFMARHAPEVLSTRTQLHCKPKYPFHMQYACTEAPYSIRKIFDANPFHNHADLALPRCSVLTIRQSESEIVRARRTRAIVAHTYIIWAYKYEFIVAEYPVHLVSEKSATDSDHCVRFPEKRLPMVSSISIASYFICRKTLTHNIQFQRSDAALFYRSINTFLLLLLAVGCVVNNVECDMR